MIGYYLLVVLCDALFGSEFLTQRQYAKKMGSGFFASMFLIAWGSILSIFIMLFLNGGKLEFTPFTALMVLARSANSLIFIFCSLKSFERVNLATYSIYTMLGGMILPIIAGVFFYHETFTVGLLLCILLIGGAIWLTNMKLGAKKTATDGAPAEKASVKSKLIAALIYAGVFITNGLSGVISKFYTEAPWPKASNEGFSLLTAIFALVYSSVIVLCMWKKRPKLYFKPTLFALCGNAGNNLANYLLLLALAVLPASTNYSLVTGGTMIVSTLLSYCTKDKPKLADWLAVACAFVGIILMLCLPYKIFVI